MKDYRKIIMLMFYLLFSGWLAGCGVRTEIYKNESVSENELETEKVIVSDNQINQVENNEIAWEELKEQLTIYQADITPEEEQEWFMDNITGTRELYRCDFADTDNYYFYTAYCDRDEKYIELLIHCDDSYYYAVTSGTDECRESLEEDILLKLGKNKKISYICTFYNVTEKEKRDICVSSRTERNGENISGIFEQKDSENEFGFKGTIQETQGIIEYDNDGKEQTGYLISLELFLNGEKIQETEEFVSHEMGNTDQDCPVWFGDYNGDGFVDFCISVFYVTKTAVADNYYIYNPEEEKFIRVPIADEKGIELEHGRNEENGYDYCMSREYRYTSDTEYEEYDTFWQWNGYEIEKYAEVIHVNNETEEPIQWKVTVTEFDSNGVKINEWYFDSEVNTADEVWKRVAAI